MPKYLYPRTSVPWVRILSLPPYSPELNPVEKLGILIKGAIANTLFSTAALWRIKSTRSSSPSGPNLLTYANSSAMAGCSLTKQSFYERFLGHFTF